MNVGTDLVQYEAGAMAERSVEDVLAQVQKIQQLMSRGMTDGEHYGVIPGTNSKPTLLKPGAEKLCFMFRLDPEYPEEKLKERWEPDGHYTVTATCVLYHIDTGLRMASGLGLCSSKEEKYGLRNAERTCPDCNAAAIVRSTKNKAFFCIRDKGGCGHRFAFGTDKGDELERQEVGKKPNDRLADSYNTVLKMACKRALIAAVLNGTAASDIFTQDLEDTVPPGSAGGAADASPAEAASDGNRGQPAGDVEESAAAVVPTSPSPDLLMTFGQHKGTRVGDLPAEYLRWLGGLLDGDEADGQFVPEDEYGGLLQESARQVVERVEKAQAIENLSSVFANLKENHAGSLPPGHQDWEAYLRWYIEGKYGLDLGRQNWRAELTTLQIREVTAYLLDMEVPV